jgi:hypothetical protein
VTRDVRRGSARPGYRLLAALLVLAASLTASPRPVGAQVGSAGVESGPGRPVVLLADPTEANTVVPAPPAPEAGTGAVATSTFQVTYTGFTPQAQAAFQRALDIWGQVISSPVPIKVDAVYERLGSGTLGQAGAWNHFRDFGAAPRTGTFYPSALANALSGQDLDTTEPDIFASFNSNLGSWYFGTDGNPPSGTYDFLSVVLHEIGHGLGFAGAMYLEGSSGGWGVSNPPFPRIYDRFTTDSNRRLLTNTSVYPNPSTALANALRSGNVYFDSALTNASDGTGRARLYAPSTWSPGSSYSHLNETTYPAGSANSLMTPFLSKAEAVHSPGPLTLCMLEAMGWATAQACPPVPPAPPVNDNFASAQTISGASGSMLNAGNVNATKQPGEPNHAGEAGGPSIWYQWTAPSGAPMRFDTAGSSFDTLLAVYTGSTVNALTAVASNDDDPALGRQSQVTFTPVGGQVYRIAVDGWNAATGTVNVQWAPTGAVAAATGVSPLSLETGQTFTASATGVPSPNTPYALRIGTLAGNCAAGVPIGGAVVSTPAGDIPATARVLPLNLTSGTRWVCWVSTEDPADHSPPVSVTVF